MRSDIHCSAVKLAVCQCGVADSSEAGVTHTARGCTPCALPAAGVPRSPCGPCAGPPSPARWPSPIPTTVRVPTTCKHIFWCQFFFFPQQPGATRVPRFPRASWLRRDECAKPCDARTTHRRASLPPTRRPRLGSAANVHCSLSSRRGKTGCPPAQVRGEPRGFALLGRATHVASRDAAAWTCAATFWRRGCDVVATGCLH